MTKSKPASSKSDGPPKSGLKRSRPKLTLPIPKIQINGGGESGPSHTHRAQTTVTEMPQLRHRFKGVAADHRGAETARRGSTPPLTNGTEPEIPHEGGSNGEARRGTVHLLRGISEERRGSLSHTPRAFKLRQLTLNYDRTKMKAPSQSNNGTTPTTPVMDGLDQKATSGAAQSADSYRPRIVSSPWSWSALLARHYYGLSNFKLCVTLIINFLLLTYKVRYVMAV